MEIPIIRLEVNQMRHTISVALARHAAELSQEIQRAVDAYCTPENIDAIVGDMVKRNIEDALRAEVEAFFRYGPGRAAIKAAVVEKLSEETEAPKT